MDSPDYRKILIKYLYIVGEAEGVYFLHPCDWTPEEWAALQPVMAEADSEETRKQLENRHG